MERLTCHQTQGRHLREIEIKGVLDPASPPVVPPSWRMAERHPNSMRSFVFFVSSGPRYVILLSPDMSLTQNAALLPKYAP